MKVDFELGPRAEHSNELVAAVADYFDLGRVDECKDLGGTYNLNLLLHTSSGKYVARIHRPWVNAERLRFLHHIKRELAAAELPVPTPLGLVSGAQLGLTSDRLIEVDPFILSEGVTDSWERYLEAFAFLGQLHQAFGEGIMTTPFISAVVQNYGLPEVLLGWLEQTKQVLEKEELTNGTREALAVCKEVEDLLKGMSSWWEQEGQLLPKHLVHGDYGGENILWSQERIVALLDFDMVDIHERVFELAYSLYWMFLRLEGEVDAAAWSWSVLREFLDAYQSAVGGELSDEELRALPLQMGRVPLFWIATAGFEPDPIQSILDRARSVESSRWLVSHMEDLSDLI